MKKFRIKIDLSTFFGDERKLVYILVDPEWESVACLQKRVEEIFDLQDVRFVTEEGCFVPPQESIQLIKCDDVLRAFLPSDSLKKKRKKPKDLQVDTSQQTIEMDAQASSGKMSAKTARKFYSLEAGFVSSISNGVKRCRNDLKTVTKNSVVNEITSTNELELGREGLRISTNQEDQLETQHSAHDLKDQEPVAIRCVTGEEGRAKKRKRKKKNNTNLFPATGNKENTAECEKDATDIKITAPDEIRSTSNVSASLSDGGKEKLELLNKSLQSTQLSFCNATPALESVPKDTGPKIIFVCSLLEEQSVKPRIFSLKNFMNKLSKSGNEVAEDISNIAESNRSAENTSNVGEGNRPAEDISNVSNRSKNLPIIQENILIVPPCKPSESKSNENGPNTSNEADDKVKNNSNAVTTKQSEEEMISPDDSSIIAIESECEDSEEETSKSKNQLDNDCTQFSEVIDINESDEDSPNNRNISTFSSGYSLNRSGKSEKDMRISKLLPYCIKLTSLPMPGDIAIFKLRRVDGKLSAFIAGQCEYVNKRTKSIKLLVVDGHREIDDIANRYICSLDNSLLADKQFLQVKLPEMIEPKVFSKK